MRFSPARQVQDLLPAGVVSEIEAMTGVMACGPLDDGWLASTETGGGPLLLLGSRLVDMILSFAGDDPVEISADVSRRADTGVDVTSAFGIRFATGRVAQCLVSQRAPGFLYTEDILGNAGRITLRGWSWLQFGIEVCSPGEEASYAEPRVIPPRLVGDHVSAMLVPQLEEFAAAIREGRAPAITLSDGRRVLPLLDAVVAADGGRAPIAAD
jgi:predicted dehydrogenase